MYAYWINVSTLYSSEVEEKIISKSCPRFLDVKTVVKCRVSSHLLEAELIVCSVRSERYVKEAMFELYTIFGYRPHSLTIRAYA